MGALLPSTSPRPSTALRPTLIYFSTTRPSTGTNFIWAVQMPGFMLVAGYFSSRHIDSIPYLWKRIVLSARNYALPFFSWFLLVTILLLGRFNRNPITAFTTLMTHVDGGLWFLWVVFVLSAITAICNFTVSTSRTIGGKITKTGIALAAAFGILLMAAKVFGLNFIGLKYILYYAVFYGFGWLVHKTEDWWKQWWPKVSGIVVTISLIIFLAIVYNFDLYHAQDNLIGISLRCIAGFAGNLVLLWVCSKYKDGLNRLHLGWLGRYTLEIYATHMYVNNLMEMGNGFFTAGGFGNFVASLILTELFTTIIIAVFKSIPAFDFVFYGKKKT